jgi:hypothetical protein
LQFLFGSVAGCEKPGPIHPQAIPGRLPGLSLALQQALKTSHENDAKNVPHMASPRNENLRRDCQ